MSPGFSLDQIDRMDRQILSLDLSGIDPGSPAAFEDVPPDHWAYKAVQHMAALGLLNGYDGSLFQGDQVVTRYELAVIVSKMLQNYETYLRQGYVEYYVPADTTWPSVSDYPPPQITYQAQPPRNARSLEATQPVKAIRDAYATVAPHGVAVPVAPRTPVGIPQRSYANRPAGSEEMTINTGASTAGAPIAFQQRNPYEPVLPSLADSVPGAPSPGGLRRRVAPTQIEQDAPVPPEEDKSKDKDKDKDENKSKDKDNGKSKVKVPKELTKIAKNFDLTEKDIAIFEELVKYTDDQIKDLKKELGGEIKDVRSIAQRNQRDIELLEEENQRYKVSGSAGFNYSSTHTEEGSENDTRTSVSNYYWTSYDVYSRPRKFDDLVLRNSGFFGSNTRLEYQDFTTDLKSPRNFKLRSIYAGQVTAPGISAFTTSLTGISLYGGVNMQFMLNDYTLLLTAGRKNSTDYLYAFSVQTSLFNNPGSFIYFTHIGSWQDKDFKNPEEENGIWGCNRADEDWADTYYPVGSFTSEDTLCLPAEKNSVSSVFLHYPLLEGAALKVEYAHSTNYRPAFNMSMVNENSSANYDNAFDPTLKYIKWRNIPERQAQDDAFVVILDYAKGPITIFPLGYIRLGSKFASRYMGLPGLDTSSLSLDLLPISVQSLEAFVGLGEYKRLDKKFKFNLGFANLREHHPMFLDPSAAVSEPALVTDFAIIDRLNNRDSELMLKGNVLMHGLTYYLTDNINLSGSFINVNIGLGPGCVDANQIDVRDDLGNLVTKTIGDGAKNCGVDEQDIKPRIRVFSKIADYSLYWRTSNRSEFNLTFGSTKLKPEISLGAGQAIDDVLLDLIPSGTTYKFNSSYKYRLTDASSLYMWYNKKYSRPAAGFAGVTDVQDWLQDNKGTHSVGFKFEMSF